jgi:hypothetical protein
MHFFNFNLLSASEANHLLWYCRLLIPPKNFPTPCQRASGITCKPTKWGSSVASHPNNFTSQVGWFETLEWTILLNHRSVTPVEMKPLPKSNYALPTSHQSSRRSKKARARPIKMRQAYEQVRNRTKNCIFYYISFQQQIKSQPSTGPIETAQTYISGARGHHPTVATHDDWEEDLEEADRLYEWTQELNFDDLLATPRLGTANTQCGIIYWCFCYQGVLDEFETWTPSVLEPVFLYHLHLVLHLRETRLCVGAVLIEYNESLTQHALFLFEWIKNLRWYYLRVHETKRRKHRSCNCNLLHIDNIDSQVTTHNELLRLAKEGIMVKWTVWSDRSLVFIIISKNVMIASILLYDCNHYGTRKMLQFN